MSDTDKPAYLVVCGTALDGEPDPEIPVISVVDLGIVRGVELFAEEAGQG